MTRALGHGKVPGTPQDRRGIGAASRIENRGSRTARRATSVRNPSSILHPPSSRARRAQRPFRPSAHIGTLLLALVVPALGGCGYLVGGAYPAEVRTVAVPVFESDSFRTGIGFRLTEAVQEQVKTRTTMLIAKESYADTILKGRIISVTKRQLLISPTDQNREAQIDLAVQVTWEDVETGRVLRERDIPLDPEIVHLVQQSEFAPEAGQSFATGSQAAIDRMARQIVDMMETPW